MLYGHQNTQQDSRYCNCISTQHVDHNCDGLQAMIDSFDVVKESYLMLALRNSYDAYLKAMKDSMHKSSAHGGHDDGQEVFFDVAELRKHANRRDNQAPAAPAMEVRNIEHVSIGDV